MTFWSLDILNLKDYGPETEINYTYVLVIKDNFSKLCWKTPLKKKNAQTITNCFEKLLICSKGKPNLIKTDCGKVPYNSIFQTFMNNKNNKY